MLRLRFKRLLCYFSILIMIFNSISVIPVSAAEHNFDEIKEFEFDIDAEYSLLDIRYKLKIPLDNFQEFVKLYNPDINWSTITNYKIGDLSKLYVISTSNTYYDMNTNVASSDIEQKDGYLIIDFSDLDFLNTGSVLRYGIPSYEQGYRQEGYFEVLDDGVTLGWDVYPETDNTYCTLIPLNEANTMDSVIVTEDFAVNSNLDFSYTSEIRPEYTVLESNKGLIARSYWKSYFGSFRCSSSRLVIKDSEGNDVTDRYNYLCGPITINSSGTDYEYMFLISDGSSVVGNTKFTLTSIEEEGETDYGRGSYVFNFVVGELPHEHLFEDATFDWSDDYSTCTADLTCGCNFVLEDVPCDVTIVSYPSTCYDSGINIYTATVPLKYNGYNLEHPSYTLGQVSTPNFSDEIRSLVDMCPHIYIDWQELQSYTAEDFRVAENFSDLKSEGYIYLSGWSYRLRTSMLSGKKVYQGKCKNYSDCSTYIIKVTDDSCTTETTSTTVEPTCTEDGYTDYLIDCPDCGDVFYQGRDTIPKLGHDLKTVWTAPTLVTKEKKTDSCKRDNCSYSTTEEFDYAMGFFAFRLYDLDLHYLDKNIEFISTSDNLSGSYNSAGGLIDFDLDFSEKDAYYTQLKIVEDDAIYQLPIKLFVDSDGLLDIELSGGTTLHYTVFDLLKGDEVLQSEYTNIDTEDVTYIGYENLCKDSESVYWSSVCLDLIESEKFNLKVIDKFGDAEEERLSEQNFKGYEYSFMALDKDGYTVVGDSIQSGTLSEDTTITFNYNYEAKPMYNLEVQDIYYDSAEKMKTTAKIETRYKEQVEEGTPYSYTALVKEGYTADGETTYEGTVTADTVIKFTYIKDAEEPKQKYKIKVIDTFGTVDKLREEKELEANSSYSYTALEKEGWLVDGNSSYSGTITEDTTIQFFYVEDTISNTEDEKVTIKVFDHFDDSIETRVNKEVDKGSKYSYSPLDKDGWVAKNDEEKTGVADKDTEIHFYYKEEAIVTDNPIQPVTKDIPQPEEPKTGDDSNYYALLILLLPVLALFINKSQKR